DDNQLFYIHFYPIRSRQNPAKIDGYLGIKANIITALFTSSRLIFTEIGSIHVTETRKDHISEMDILAYIQFKPVANPVFDELKKISASALIYGFILILLFILVLYFLVQFIISRPLEKLTAYIEQLKLGRAILTPELSFPIFELNNLKQSLDAYQAELEKVYSNLDQKNEELWELAHHDSLTGVANRRAHDEDWKSYLAIAQNKRLDLSYMLIDCDHFKAINDTYGHDIGDKLIIAMASLLQNSLREGDKLYRIGGDEFITILWNTNADTAEKIAERCLKNIRAYPFSEIGINETVTISIGIAHCDCDSSGQLDDLPRKADIAMYHAKKPGSRSIIHYDKAYEQDAAPLVSNRVIDAVLKAANASEGLIIYYQPIINSETGTTEYYEALLRIEDGHGIIGAGDIFPVAEKLSLEAELDLEIIKHIKNDFDNGIIPIGTGVSINFSSALLSLPDLTQHIKPLCDYLQQHIIVLEVTEKTLITNLSMASMKLSELRQLGFQIALDDFGSGYSSIRYLANMPVDIVKFDISMTRQLATADKSRSIISGTARVILDSGFKLVAEGIENDELKQLVLEMGATHMQGYALGRPMQLFKN
ncbi:MAG TPA: EAL domain-containing protein, partial [Gammaproteobacteria bacterium]